MSGGFRRKPPLQLKDLRSLGMSHLDRREAEVYKLRRLLFGIDEEGAPHLNALRKGLESRRLQHWYPPSKYSHLDFRLEQYVTMQTQRFSAREASASLQCLRKTVLNVFHNRAWIEPLLKQCRVSKDLMKKHPTLQDLSALLDMSHSMFVEAHTAVPSDGVQEVPGPGGRYLWYGDREKFGSAAEVPVPSVTQHQFHKIGVATLVSAQKAANQKAAETEQAQEPAATVFYAPPVPLLGLHPCTSVKVDKVVTVPLKDSQAKAVKRAVTVETPQAPSTEKLAPSMQRLTKRLDIGGQRYRFIDPLYARRRTAFLRRKDIHKLRPKKRAALAHYCVNPQTIREFPSHRGALFVRYPSVHK